MLAAFTLWAVTVYLRLNKKEAYYWIALIPAIFMTMVTVSFMFVSSTFFGALIPRTIGYILAAVITLGVTGLFFGKAKCRE
jgi:carbon starvation protein CstA